MYGAAGLLRRKRVSVRAAVVEGVGGVTRFIVLTSDIPAVRGKGVFIGVSVTVVGRSFSQTGGFVEGCAGFVVRVGGEFFVDGVHFGVLLRRAVPAVVLVQTDLIRFNSGFVPDASEAAFGVEFGEDFLILSFGTGGVGLSAFSETVSGASVLRPFW